ncbi:MAG: radical SAM protein [Candidatus Thorarchaeota archaeon]|nr:radical SAM protein [Candidatus Thorarchaeota archaeon]
MDLEDRYRAWQERVQQYISCHPIQMVYWEVTRNCDMSCVHCGSPSETWEPEKELTNSEIIKAFRRLAEGIDWSEFKFVSLTGGEPFVRPNLVPTLAQINAMGFTPITIQTNGNYLSRHPETLDVLLDIGVTGLGTNFDGLPETHDSFRNMKGNFENARATIELVVPFKDKIHSTITTVVSKKNIHELEPLREIIRDINPNRWRFAPFDPIGRGAKAREFPLDAEDYRYLIDFVRRERLEYIDDKNQTQVELACGGWLGIELEGRVRPYIWHCVAGINLLGILYDGSIASCSNIPRHFIEGNIREEDILDVWQNRFQRYRCFDWKRIGDCVDCDQWDYCQGGPMHKRLPDGTMLNCIYKCLFESGSHTVSVLDNASKILTGN